MALDVLDPEAFAEGVREVTARSHNLPPELREEAIGNYISNTFDAATSKCGDYLCGSQIFERPGYFNGLSLGNWLTVASEAGVPFIPARFLTSAPSVLIYSLLCGLRVPDPQVADANAFLGGLQDIKPGEMLRFDMCAAATIKAALSDGGDIQAGWHERDGVKYPDVDGRLVHAILNYTFEYLPVFARPIVPLRMVDGDVADCPRGRWPREWRVFVREGRVTGVSNYYLQAPAKLDEAPGAMRAASLAARMIATLERAGSWPHHPRMEGVFNTESVSCSLDFAETADGGMVLVEGGPPHIFSPAWGAHPCCFMPGAPIEGIALALGTPPLDAGLGA